MQWVSDEVFVRFAAGGRDDMERMRRGRVIWRSKYYVLVLVRGRSGACWRECYDPSDVAVSRDEYVHRYSRNTEQPSKVRSPWTDEDLEVARRMKESGATYAEIARAVGRSKEAVRSKIRARRRRGRGR